MSSCSASDQGSPRKAEILESAPQKSRILAIESAPGGEFGSFVAPKSPIYAENASEKGSPGTLGCILGPEPCPKVMPTLPLVPVASQNPGWESPRDADGVTKMNSAEENNCGVGLANHPMGEGTGDRPRGFTELLLNLPK